MAEQKQTQQVEAERTGRPEPDRGEALLPLVDIYEESDGTTVLAAELPGAGQDSLDVRVDKGVLTISAEAPSAGLGETHRPVYTGFTGGTYYRAFALSDEIDREKIEADLSDGVLTVRLPRAAAAQTRKIEIK